MPRINAKEYFERLYAKAAAAPSNGRLLVITTRSKGTYPIQGARISVYDSNGNLMLTELTDESGRTDTVVLPSVSSSLSQSPGTPPSDTAVFYDIDITADGFVPTRIEQIPIYDGVTTIQRYDMTLLAAAPDDQPQKIVIPYNSEL